MGRRNRSNHSAADETLSTRPEVDVSSRSEPAAESPEFIFARTLAISATGDTFRAGKGVPTDAPWCTQAWLNDAIGCGHVEKNPRFGHVDADVEVGDDNGEGESETSESTDDQE